MPVKKGEQVEAGIWRKAVGKGYVAEVFYRDPVTRRRIREQKTVHRLDLAREWRQARKTDAFRGEIRGQKERPRILFSRFVLQYWAAWAADRKPSTVRGEWRRLDGILNPYFGTRYLDTISRKDIEEFLTKRRDGSLADRVAMKRRNRRRGGVSSATTNRDLCRLKNMFRYAVNWGYLDSNPAIGIRQARERMRHPEYLGAEEVRGFLTHAEPEHRPVFLTAVYTGMRYGEIMALEWRDVVWTWDRLAIRDTKNGEDRFVPMNAQVRSALLGLLPADVDLHRLAGSRDAVFVNDRTGNPYRDLRKAMRRALDAAGITRHIRFHDLRHTTGSHLAMNGATEREIAEVLGHRDPTVTRRYAHLSPAHVKGVIDRLDFTAEKDTEATSPTRVAQ